MLKAQDINFLLAELYAALKERIPKLRQTVVGAVEGVPAVGTFGALVVSGLLVGGVEGKITIILEWETALKLVSKLLKAKSEVFSEEGQLALEEVIKIALEKTAAKLSETYPKTDLYLLPTLTDANVLLAMHPGAEVIKILIHTLWEPIQLYLAFPPTQAVANAA